MKSNRISKEDLRQVIPQLQAGWWTSKTEEEKAWYRRFWAHCNKK